MLSKLRYEPDTKTIRTVPGNHWVATLDSWDGAIKPDLDAYGRLMAAAPALHQFAALISRMTTAEEMRAEHGGDPHEGDESLETLSALIEDARRITKEID